MKYTIHQSPLNRLTRILILSGSLLLIASALVVYFATYFAEAAPVQGFNAGRIIDDNIFTNKSTMSVSKIQSFLSTRVPNCDTYGAQLSEYGGPDLNHDGKVQRWEWGKANYNQTKFVCLKDYVENDKKAAQIIYEKAQKYTINPQVLIVLLQKEQGLVNDTWPLNIQYKTATGYGCPDTAPCASEYFGLSNQLDWSAKMFRAIMNNSPTWYTPYILGKNYIQYNPSSSCGGSYVTIQNRATQALYNYTPYQPNKAALDAGWGTAPCGAYGNRNFYLYFTQWFGNTTSGPLLSYDLRIVSPISITPIESSNLSSVSFVVKNVGGRRISFDKTIVQCRNYQKEVCDSNEGSPWYLDPDQERTFTYTIDVSEANTYTIIPYLYMNKTWYQYGTLNGSKNKIVKQVPSLSIVSNLSTNPKTLQPRTSSSISFDVKNTGNSPITIDKSVVQCRYNISVSCDSNYGGSVTIKPGEVQTYGYTMTTKDGGDHVIIPYYMVDGVWYTYKPTTGFQANMTVNVADLELTGPITISDPNPIPGEEVTVTATIRNKGPQAITSSRFIVQCLLNSTKNCYLDYTLNDTINAGATKTYTKTMTIGEAGLYSFTPYYEYLGNWQTYQKGTAPSNTLSVTAPRYLADMRLTGPITFSPEHPRPNQTITVNYSVKNYGTRPAYYQRSILQCRLNTTVSCDPDYNQYGIVIQPGETKSFSNSFSGVKPGMYTFTPYYEQNTEWHTYQPATTNNQKIYVHPLTIISPITISPSSPSRNSTATVTYTVKNFSNQSISVVKPYTQCRVGTKKCDSAYGSNFVLAAGQERTLTQRVSITSSGTYRLQPQFTWLSTTSTYGFGDGADWQKSFVVN